jgi:hypothetical protein
MFRRGIFGLPREPTVTDDSIRAFAFSVTDLHPDDRRPGGERARRVLERGARRRPAGERATKLLVKEKP